MEYFVVKYKTDTTEGSGGAKSAALEDSIMHKGRQVAAGSRMLDGFVSPIDATVVTKLETAGVEIIGKTGMDEFGVAGLFGDAKTISGAVGAVADGLAGFALANDYTGAIACRAASDGLCCIRPTYGTVSRYGLIPAVSSMDQIGVIAKDTEDCFRILDIIAGFDEKDGVMLPDSVKGSTQNGNQLSGAGGAAHSYNEVGSKPPILGVPMNAVYNNKEQSSKEAIAGFGKHFATTDIELPYLDVYPQVMQILCCAEFGSNISRYDGIKFGHRAGDYANLHELYTKSRTEAFGAEAKLTALIGAMVLSRDNYMKYYDKAMRIRRLIISSLDWNSYDVILMTANKDFMTSEQQLGYRALPRLCGLPSITFPFCGVEATLIAGPGREYILSAVLKKVGI
jgi:aspartyl-tRNA(Asn)/glutamyl-tRNA(Gln) amidotransferase subunit A